MHAIIANAAPGSLQWSNKYEIVMGAGEAGDPFDYSQGSRKQN